ncbi:hypothetical protein ACGTN6_20810, partial [Halomonas sp. THAF12]|uniref:hypothetical protein n=1 Tax=Halomonas sp. B23F22_10 TaxID=3459515 RepID=UPI00373EB159
MKSIRGAVGLATLVILSGCASGEHLYMGGECVTCVTNPVTGEPINYDPDATPEELRGQTIEESIHGSNMAGDFEMGSSLDVDTAYARIKSEFGFRSPQDFDANDRFRKMR